MGRLIDADKFKGKVIASHTGSGVIKLIAIDEVPTAYNSDKVIRQIKELSIRERGRDKNGRCDNNRERRWCKCRLMKLKKWRISD